MNIHEMSTPIHVPCPRSPASALSPLSTLVAFLIWIVCATLLYITECDNERLDGAFDTIPKSMFFTILFLGGEWAMTDFTPVGKCIGVVIVLLVRPPPTPVCRRVQCGVEGRRALGQRPHGSERWQARQSTDPCR